MANSEASALAEGPREADPQYNVYQRLIIAIIKRVENEARNSVTMVSPWSRVFVRDSEKDAIENALRLMEQIAPALTGLMEQVKSKEVINMAPVTEIHKSISKHLIWFERNLGGKIPSWPVNDSWKHVTNDEITGILNQVQDNLKKAAELLKELIQEGDLYNQMRKKQSSKRCHSETTEGDSLPPKQAKQDQTNSSQQPSSSSQFARRANIMPRNDLFDGRNFLRRRELPEVLENQGSGSSEVLEYEGRDFREVPVHTDEESDSEDICFLADAYMKFGLLGREPKDERESQLIKKQIRILKKRSLMERNVSQRVPYQEDHASTHLKQVLYKLIDECNMPLMDEEQSNGAGQKKSKVPHLLFTTDSVLDGTYENGQTIVDAAKNSGANENRVYIDELEFVDKKMKRRFYKHHGFDGSFGEETGKVLPVVTVNPDTPDLEDFQTVAHELSSFVIQDATKVFGVEKNAFTREEVIKAVGDQKCDVLIQRSQHSSQNFSMYSSMKDKRPGQAVQRSWHQPGGSIKVRKLVKDILGGNHATRQEFVEEAVEKFLANPEHEDTIMMELTENLRKSQVEPTENNNKTKKTPLALTSAFATNLEFHDLAEFEEQAEMLDKMWDMLQPGYRLFAHCEKIIGGMNGVQAYVKEPGSRTPGHLENQVVASVNWNMGPGDCVWILVPLAYAPKMEEMMCQKKVWPYTTPYWPSERDLINNGISYQKIIQKTDELVYVGVGTYHWVQANGPCVNVAWNVAEITSLQLAATALNVDHCAEHKYQIVFPFESILWDLALKNVQPPNDERFWSFAKCFLARSLAKCQFEWSFMESDTNKTGAARHFSEFKNGELLFECYRQNTTEPKPYCHQKLYNLTVVHHDQRHGLRELCYNCAAKLKSGERSYYYRYTMDQLISIFDNYKKVDE